MRPIILLLALLMFSCQPSQNDQHGFNKKAEIQNGLSSQLNQKLTEYQARFPIATVQRKGGLYLYEVLFYKEKQDTFIQLSLSPDGFITDPSHQIYGVYTGKNLYPTVVKDSKEQYSRDFIDSNLADTTELFKYKRKASKDYPEIFPPLYKYKLQNGNMVLNSIDSVWLSW